MLATILLPAAAAFVDDPSKQSHALLRIVAIRGRREWRGRWHRRPWRAWWPPILGKPRGVDGTAGWLSGAIGLEITTNCLPSLGGGTLRRRRAVPAFDPMANHLDAQDRPSQFAAFQPRSDVRMIRTQPAVYLSAVAKAGPTSAAAEEGRDLFAAHAAKLPRQTANGMRSIQNIYRADAARSGSLTILFRRAEAESTKGALVHIAHLNGPFVYHLWRKPGVGMA
jgi:hypothetical protein